MAAHSARQRSDRSRRQRRKTGTNEAKRWNKSRIEPWNNPKHVQRWLTRPRRGGGVMGTGVSKGLFKSPRGVLRLLKLGEERTKCDKHFFFCKYVFPSHWLMTLTSNDPRKTKHGTLFIKVRKLIDNWLIDCCGENKSRRRKFFLFLIISAEVPLTRTAPVELVSGQRDTGCTGQNQHHNVGLFKTVKITEF